VSSSLIQRELADGKLLIDEPSSGVVRLTISNPAKRNALDHSILDAIVLAVRDLNARCLILTGAGDMFSSGYDIAEIPHETFAETAEKLVAHLFTEALEALECIDE